MVMAAPTAKVWQSITHSVNYTNETNFFFKNGVNYPLGMCLQKRGDSSFLLQVEDFQSFATAMQRRLLSEIAARPALRRAAMLNLPGRTQPGQMQ